MYTGIIDADAHVVENEQVWDYLEPSEKKYRPTFVPQPDNPERGRWFLDGEFLGNKFPAPGEKQAEEHVKKFGRVVATPIQSRELDDVSMRLKHMDELGIAVQVLFNSMWISPVTSRADAEIALCWGWNRWMADVWKRGEGRLALDLCDSIIDALRSHPADSLRKGARSRWYLHATLRKGSGHDRSVFLPHIR